MNNESEQQLAVRKDPFAVETLDEAIKLAGKIAESGMCGLKTAAQVLTAMKMAADDKTTLTQFLRRYHVHEDGKISQRADYTQGDFESNGGWVLFHVRTDEMCAASFGVGEGPDEAARERALTRFELMWKLEYEEDPRKRSELIMEIAKNTLGREVTVYRTLDDAKEKGIATTWKQKKNSQEWEEVLKHNWKMASRQMLHARVITEGIGAVDPARRANAYTEDELDDIRATEAQRETGMKLITGQPENDKVKQIEWMIAEKQKELQMDISPNQRQRLLGEISDLKLDLEEARGASAAPTQPASTPLAEKRGADTPESDQLDLTPIVEAPPPPDWRSYRIVCVKAKEYKGKTLGELAQDKDTIDVLWEKRGQPHLDDADKALRTEARMIKLAYDELSVKITKKGKK